MGISKPILPGWAPDLAIRLLLLAVLLDVLAGMGALVHRWGSSFFTEVLAQPGPGPHTVASAAVVKASLLVPACLGRPWALLTLALAYLLSQPLFLAFAGLLHLDPLLSPVLYQQAKVAAPLAAGLLFLAGLTRGRGTHASSGFGSSQNTTPVRCDVLGILRDSPAHRRES